ncbi:MAG: STAS domain-containing protein [Caldilineales bacterium]|nr:STAS domain-containing protein [Caldilineales bacterium]
MTATNATFERQELKRCDVYRVGGRLGGDSSAEFEGALKQSMDAGTYNLVLNLSAVTFISSAALRVLVNTAKECRSTLHRGDLRLAETPDAVQKVLKLAGLDELFKQFESESEAVGSF